MKQLLLVLAIIIVSGTSPLAIAQTDWGPEDTIGSANYLSADKSLKAVRLVKDGKVFN